VKEVYYGLHGLTGIKGLSISLIGQRKVALFRTEDGSYLIQAETRGVNSKQMLLSAEAFAALLQLMYDLSPTEIRRLEEKLERNVVKPERNKNDEPRNLR
jgi:hypothetical protein